MLVPGSGDAKEPRYLNLTMTLGRACPLPPASLQSIIAPLVLPGMAWSTCSLFIGAIFLDDAKKSSSDMICKQGGQLIFPLRGLNPQPATSS